jgi:hypothetical protein
MLLAAATACQDRHWTPEQRARLREQIRAYREWSYIQNMNEAEFLMLTDDVAALIEGNYANLTEFNNTPGSNDSITTTVVGVVANYITTDARNMRYLFPYHHLVRQGVLPDGMSREHIRDFYKCMASKINSGYVSMESFLWAAMQNKIDATVVGTIQRDCAGQVLGTSSVFGEDTHAEATEHTPRKDKHDKHKDDKKKSNDGKDKPKTDDKKENK